MNGTMRMILIGLTLVLVSQLGCTRHFSATAKQPNPLAHPKEMLRRSETLIIELKDVDLAQYVLPNRVFFNVVSKDRLRFHVRLVHKWEEHADVTSWDVWLEDETGKRYRPVSKEKVENSHQTKIVDYDRRAITVNSAGDITNVSRDPNLRQPLLASFDTFRGRGDYVFYSPEIFTKDRTMLRLVMKKGGVEFSYRWDFADGVIELNHYRQSRSRNMTGSREVEPGRLTGGF